jgi:hypothetical protein
MYVSSPENASTSTGVESAPVGVVKLDAQTLSSPFASAWFHTSRPAPVGAIARCA